MIKKAIFIAWLAWMSLSTVSATMRYLDPNGTDSGDCSSQASPCKLYSYGLTQSVAGDDFQWAAGTYTLSGHSITGFSGASAANPTEIRCATPLGCTIKNSAPVNISGATYNNIKIGGFLLWNIDGDPSLVIESPDATALNSQTYNIEVSTTFGYSEVHSNVNTVAWSIARVSTSNFINVGSIGGRYSILVYGCWRINMWRTLASWEDWTPLGGQNPAGGLAVYDTQQSTFTHFFVHDTQSATDPDILDNLGIYVPSNDNGTTSPFTTTERVRLYSGAVINNRLGHCFGNEGGSGGSNVDVRLINYALLGCNGVGITVARKSTNFRAENVTISSTNWASDTMAVYGGGSGDTVSGSVITQSNLAHGPQDGLNGDWTNTNINVYGYSGSAYSGGASAGAGDTATDPVFIYAIISTNTAVTPKGADLRFEYDKQGAVTATKLWHWPYECTIKDFYKRTIGLNYGIFGTTYTYTQYFWRWKYGNNPPADYNSTCTDGTAYSDSEYGADTSSPTAPGTPTVTSTGTTTLDISWAASSDEVGVTSYEIDVDNNSDFSSPLAGYDDQDIGSGTTEQITGLSISTQYYFRLRAKDAAGNTSSSSTAGTGTTNAVEEAAVITKMKFKGSVTFKGNPKFR